MNDEREILYIDSFDTCLLTRFQASLQDEKHDLCLACHWSSISMYENIKIIRRLSDTK